MTNGDLEKPSWLTEEGPSPPTNSITGAVGSSSDLNTTPSWVTPESNSGSNVQQQQQQQQQLPPTTTTPLEVDTTTTTTTPVQPQPQPQQPKTWRQYWAESFQRDGRTLLITLLILVIMNIPYGNFVLYPFTIFSTWIHELCHGMAAIMVPGGQLLRLDIYKDTSGLAYTAIPSNRQGFVASAGYQGTAVIGCLLLLVRRTKRGPRTGCMAISLMMILSVMLWVRNAFGIVFILLLGLLLAAAAWKLNSNWMRNLYIVLAVTCALNSITSIKALFGSNHQVNGQDVTTDAHSMANIKGGSSTIWAILWFLLAIGLGILGYLFAIPGPDEVADFTCCGVCQDWGLFACCNAPGLRLFQKLFGTTTTNNTSSSSTTTPQEQDNTGTSNNNNNNV